MASIRKYRDGWRVEVQVKGARESATFASKREASTWGAQREIELRAIAAGRGDTVRTLADLLKRYREDVAPQHRGARWEQIRLEALARQLPADRRLVDVTPETFAKWRDQRLQEVSRGTVIRELGLLAAAFEVARREWRWVASNPLADVAKPPAPAHRDRLVTRAEIRAVVRVLGYRSTGRLSTLSESVGLCFLVAMRTGMRAGELCGLTWADLRPGVARLAMTKNGTAREVPLSRQAQRLIERGRSLGVDTVFGLQTNTLDALFRRARVKAGLSGFTFHDARHFAATHLARKLSLLELCRALGWTNTSQALTYFNESAEAMARKLSPAPTPPRRAAASSRRLGRGSASA